MAEIKIAILEKDGEEYLEPTEYDLETALREVGAGHFIKRTNTVYTNSSNATWNQPSELVVNCTAGKVYRVEWVGIYKSANAGTGLSVQLSGSASFSKFSAQISSPISNATTLGQIAITAFNTAYTFASVPSANTDYIFLLQGVFVCNTSGNLAFNFRSENNNTAITIESGSIVSYMEI